MFATSDLRVEVEKLLASELPANPFELFRLKAMIDCAWSRALESYDRSEAWREDGFGSAASALLKRCGIKKGAANHTIRLARKLRVLPETDAAWGAGEITQQHADVIANAFTAKRDAVLRDLNLERYFVDAAKASDPTTLGEVVRRATDAIDGDDGATEAEIKRERRRLHVSKTIDDMRIGEFVYDREDGQVLETALKLYEDPYRTADPRTRAQRRADALIEICRSAIANRNDLTNSVHAEIGVRIDLADLEGRGCADLAADLRALKGDPIPRAMLDRLMCDARIWRIITDGPSQVLDVGRASRDFTVAQKRAILARDQVCTKCGAPGNQCDYHHILPWEDGGPTNVDNGRLECRPCHIQTHKDMRGPP